MKKIDINTIAFTLVDVQDRLFPFMEQKENLANNLEILIKGLKLLEVPFLVNEQYKKGIGETIEPLKSLVENYTHFEKTTFSCCRNKTYFEDLKKLDKKQIIVAGIETHICVLQTCLDLLDANFEVILVVDCCSSRKLQDKDIAIQRLVQAGVVPTTYESLLFELVNDAKHPKFKEISALVK